MSAAGKRDQAEQVGSSSAFTVILRVLVTVESVRKRNPEAGCVLTQNNQAYTMKTQRQACSRGGSVDNKKSTKRGRRWRHLKNNSGQNVRPDVFRKRNPVCSSAPVHGGLPMPRRTFREEILGTNSSGFREAPGTERGGPGSSAAHIQTKPPPPGPPRHI